MAICIPFLGVPHMEKTILWYQELGFSCTGSNRFWDPGADLSWAQMEWEGAAFMLFYSGKEENSETKDAGLYFRVSSFNGLVEKLKHKARIIELTEQYESPTQQVVFEDLNGYRVTFSCD